MADRYSRLTSSTGDFSQMLARFGVVTVMNVKVYDIDPSISFDQTADKIVAAYSTVEGHPEPRAILDTLKISNFTEDGPTKTINGGQYSNPLIKFGKTARLEMQDALGNSESLEVFGAGLNEYSETGLTTRIAFHATDSFAAPKLLIGDSFFIDQSTGNQIPVQIIIYQFLPDSLLNLTQDASGDAAVFDLNGDVLITEIEVGGPTVDPAGNPVTTATTVPTPVFYSILPGTISD